MGKTSLVSNLNLENQYLISIDFKEAKTKQDLIPLIVKAILSKEQQLQVPQDFPKLFKKFSIYSPTMSLNKFQEMEFTINPSGDLKIDDVVKLIESINDKTPVLFLDNVQHAYSLNKDLSFQIVEALKPFTLIVCEAIDVFKEHLHFDFLSSKMNFIELGALDSKQYQKFVTQKLALKNLELSPEMFNLILEEVGDLSFERQMFFNNLFEMYQDQAVSSDHIKEVFNQIIDQYSELYEMMLEDLTDNQKNTLVQLSFNPDIKVYSKQFCEDLNIQNTNTVVKILQSLIKKKLLYKNNSSYQVFSPFFKRWITLVEKQR